MADLTRSSSTPTSSVEWLPRLHSRLLAMYGISFRNLFQSPEAVQMWMDTWGSALSDLSEQQLQRGLAACLTESPKFAPSLGEFRQMCLGPQQSTRPEHRLMLPAPRDTKDRSEDLARIKALLGKRFGKVAA